MNKGSIPLAGVIGDPISHSKSPTLHGRWLKEYGIAGHYIPMRVTEGNLATVIRALPKLGFVGINVTIPHKISVMSLADQVSDRAILIGAANTLTFRGDGKVIADNTDGYGFLKNLKENAADWDPKSGPAVVIGAGGAARAILSALSDAGVPEIYLSNRTRAKAEALKSDFGTRIKVVDWVQAGNVIEDARLVVNTTSLGMKGQPELRVPLDGLRPGTIVNDLVYSPLQTQFLKTAEEKGCIAVDGLGMLLHQAAPGFERWFGVSPTVDDELRRAVLA